MTWREQYKYLPVRVSTTSCNNIRLAHRGLVVAAVEIQKGNFDNEVFGYLLKSKTCNVTDTSYILNNTVS